MWRLSTAERRIALTFDDGPHPEYTPAVLDLLARLDVRATFFVVGRNVDRHPLQVERMVREGHAVGGHSYDHTVITSQTAEALADDLTRCADAIRRAGHVDSNLFRPPKGDVDLASMRRVCRLGYRLVHWTRTYSDFQQDGTMPLLARMNEQPPSAGDIVLLHDHNSHTVAALADQIPRWRAAGFGFCTL
ncbi:MAG: polysaccharide deacetylase family protein [Mycobacteriales bacterium]